MRIESLSDHAGHMLQQTKEQQELLRAQAGRAQDRIRGAQLAEQDAKRSKPLWKRVLFIRSADEKQARRDVEAAKDEIRLARDRWLSLNETVQQQSAGVRGEDVVAASLGGSLSNEWLMFRGYRNRQGEADLVLVGPRGVWVVEVKNRNARLFVDGDSWRYEKLDRYSNVVDRGTATDKSGRSWGRQAGDVADGLVWWLDRNHHRVPVRTAVMLIHDRASIQSIRNPGVDLVSIAPDDLVRAIESHPSEVDADEQQAIAALIRRDHDYHNPPPAGGA